MPEVVEIDRSLAALQKDVDGNLELCSWVFGDATAEGLGLPSLRSPSRVLLNKSGRFNRIGAHRPANRALPDGGRYALPGWELAPNT